LAESWLFGCKVLFFVLSLNADQKATAAAVGDLAFMDDSSAPWQGCSAAVISGSTTLAVCCFAISKKI